MTARCFRPLVPAVAVRAARPQNYLTRRDGAREKADGWATLTLEEGDAVSPASRPAVAVVMARPWRAIPDGSPMMSRKGMSLKRAPGMFMVSCLMAMVW